MCKTLLSFGKYDHTRSSKDSDAQRASASCIERIKYIEHLAVKRDCPEQNGSRIATTVLNHYVGVARLLYDSDTAI